MTLRALLTTFSLASFIPTEPVHGHSSGAPLIQAYPRQTYGGVGQVFTITQDSRGVMYFATAPALIEFDGERWRSTPTEGALIALASDERNRLIMGGPNRIGYFASDATGRLSWTPLHPLLPEAQREFRGLWPVVNTSRGLMMAAREHLFLYRDGAFKAWPGSVEKVFYRIYELSGRLFIAQLGHGLVELTDEDQLLRVSDDSLDPLAEINAMFALDDGSFLLFTRLHGVHRLTDQGLEPVQGPASRWLREQQVQHGCRLPDGRLAIATRRGGVAVLDEDLTMHLKLDQSSGLTHDGTSYVFVDSQRNLWIATDDGVNRVIFDTELESYGPKTGLPRHSVLSLATHGDELLVGTDLGLYRGLRKQGPGPDLRFEPVGEIASQTWDTQPVDDAVLVGTTDGIYEVRIRGGDGVSIATADKVYGSAAPALQLSGSDPDLVFAGTAGGLGYLQRRDGRWTWAGRFAGIRHRVQQLEEGASGELLAWLPDLQQIAIISFPDGLEGEPRLVLHDIGHTASLDRVDGRLVLTGSGQFERYLGWPSALGDRAFEPDPELAALGDGNPNGFLYLQDSEGRMWAAVKGRLQLATRHQDGFQVRPATHQVLELPFNLLEDPLLENVFWLGTAEGLLRLSPGRGENPRPPPAALVRRVVRLADGQLLEAGGPRPPRSTGIDPHDGPAPDSAGPVLEYAHNGLRFEFAAPIFDQQTDRLYRVRLDGFDEDWTPWSSEDFKEYSLLPEGLYNFRVEAQNARGAVGPEASYSFRVKPPWYRTPWTYAAYFLAAVGTLLMVARLRTLGLERRNRQLEHDVKDRTRELADGMVRVAEQAKDLEEMNLLLAEENEHRRLLEVERSKLQTRVEQSQKLESLGLMAGGIAHDFNNILTAIMGNADLCLDEDELPEPLARRLQSISSASQRAAELCQQMLAYAGKGQLEEKELDLSKITRETLELLQVSIDPKIEIRTELARRLPAFIGDPTKVRQLIMNLLTNGAEAIGESRGVLRAMTGERHLTASDLEKIVLADPIPEGPYVFLRVEDSGEGMDEETRRKIFDPFFTTKFAGRGLGLAAALGILRSHAGAISVTSAAGQGTAFEVYFPALDHSADDLAAPSTEEIRRWRTTGTILVVDDEHIVREVLTLMLRNTGFEVLVASGGAEAIEIFEREGHRVGAVILDLTMPGLDGLETFAELRRLDPEVKVILSSGYSGDTLVERYLEQGFAGFVPKPFKVTALRETLRGVLG